MQKQQLHELHMRCIKKTLDFINEKAAFTRFKVNGDVYHEQTKLMFGMFPHHESRDEDMQEHVHVVAFNLCKDSSGNYAATDSRPLFIWRTAAAARYHVEFAYQLMDQAKIYCEKDERNFACPVVPKELCDYFSTRRATIEEVAKELRDHIESRSYGVKTQLSDLASKVIKQVPHLRADQCDISDVANRNIATIISKITRNKKINTPYSQYLELWQMKAQESGVDLSFLDRVASNSLVRKNDPSWHNTQKKNE